MSGGQELLEWQGASVESWRERWQLPELRLFAEVSSTNDVIRAAGLSGAPAGATALADHQSSGRGRLGRPWAAPPGTALLCSVLLRPAPHGAPEAAGVLPLRVGLAVADVIRRVTGTSPALKWPNDVLLHGGKVAGILCESSADFVVVGIGINVLQQAHDFPSELAGTAISLRLATGLSLDRAILAGTLLEQLRPLFTAPHRPLDANELAAFGTIDALRGREVTVEGEPAGMATGVEALGALLVVRDGQLRALHTGTVRKVT